MLNSIQIITELSIWFTFFCVLLGVLYSYILYRKEERFKDLSKWKIRLMGGFRFLLITILAFLLLSPFIKKLFNKTEKPIIIIAQDNSSSLLLNKDSVYYKSTYLKTLNELQTKLEENYEVKRFLFGDEVKEGKNVDFTKKITNIANVFDEVNNKFYNRNVGALILASDGIYNQGTNPIYNTGGTNFPVYTIALGDTTIPKDIVIKEVVHNKITFLSNQFPIEIYAEAKELKGKKTTLNLIHNGKKLYTKNYNLTTSKESINEKIIIEANEIGVQHYQIEMSTVSGEISKINNKKDIYIEVLDGRQNILVLANAPHPDIKALKLAIESNENYKVTTQLFNEFDGNTSSYSLMIVHQLPNTIPTYFKAFDKNKISTWYILGTQTSAAKFNTLNVGLTINKANNRFNLILPEIADNFPLFTITNEDTRIINSFPPLLGPFGNYQTTTNGYSLLSQKIGNVSTNEPLMMFFQNSNQKTAVLAGEGIWKWRMQDYMKNNNHNTFNNFINKVVQFLSVKEDKSKFRVITQDLFLENEEIILNAELYNDSYELINEPEITIDMTDEAGSKFNYVFNKTSSAYLLNAGILPIGYYNYTAKVKWGTKEYIEKGKFQINPILLEENATTADHQLLQNIAGKYGGKMIYPSELKNIVDIIKENNNIVSIIYEEDDLKELINLKWIFFLLLTLLSIEWFLRKRNGAY